ncbi:hypothetical protein Ocin01_09650 [Orchesella cincta]|uniref:Uncharacterized protein n=1 Tax=Orchesella cincta TaxID=48709 RepID=A0A1D2MVC3_ORCCI|nr:hypothetical protein Ocin01_09650 [Orchesella cincta]
MLRSLVYRVALLQALGQAAKHILKETLLLGRERRANLHQSTGSLHSADSQSSNGLSPSPSPSPYNRGTPSPKNGVGGNLSPAATSISPNQLRNGGTNGTPSPLAKRWSSTSDFHSGSTPSLFSQNSAMAASQPKNWEVSRGAHNKVRKNNYTNLESRFLLFFEIDKTGSYKKK